MAWTESAPGGQADARKKPGRSCEGPGSLGQVWTVFHMKGVEGPPSFPKPCEAEG